MDNEIKKEIIELIDKTKFGKITIELNEANDHVDIKKEETIRIFKKKHIPKIILKKVQNND